MIGSPKNISKMTVFLGILVVHWIVQFVAWSYAERNYLMRLLWKIWSTPLLEATGSLANEYFWFVATANSLLWSAALTYVVARYALKRRS
jgi:hypothetical protein